MGSIQSWLVLDIVLPLTQKSLSNPRRTVIWHKIGRGTRNGINSLTTLFTRLKHDKGAIVVSIAVVTMGIPCPSRIANTAVPAQRTITGDVAL